MIQTSTIPAPTALSRAQDLRCEHLINPLGVERSRPRLSWQMKPVPGGQGQETTGWRILVSSRPELLVTDHSDLWDSGKVSGRRPTQVSYRGAPLQSLQSCYWKVKLWDEKGKKLPWSESARWIMGILSDSAWSGEWIGHTPPDQADPFAEESFDRAR